MEIRLEYLVDCPQAIETLAQWHFAQWGHFNPQRTLPERIARLQSHNQRCAIPTTVVALHGDSPLGSASLVECDLQTRSDLRPWLASVYVAKEYRGRGVGNALVERIEHDARQLGVQTLYLFTQDRAAFYARRGWQNFAVDIVADHPVVVMSLDL